ncbi:MAG: biotin--[acetyl-CoA-carboxylase] ligase [Candidatus Aminicenantia bacterium]
MNLHGIGEKIIFLSQCSSTNDLARESAEMGEAHGTIFRCGYQTAGRGKEGKVWFSSPGKGLYFSVIIRPQEKNLLLSWLPYIAAISVCEAIKEPFELNPAIKWPNDVYINGKKVCGILIETSSDDKKVDYAIVGIGINVNQEEKDFPEGIREKAISIKMAVGSDINIEDFFEKVLKRLNYWYKVLVHKELYRIHLTLNSFSLISPNSNIEIFDGQRVFKGEFLGFDLHGALLLKNREGVQKIYSGEMISFKL